MVLFYPFLVLVSPFIFLFIKFQSALRPNNEFIKAQAKFAAVGESMLEAAPQYGVQLFIILKILGKMCFTRF